jgi:hypothetical protein
MGDTARFGGVDDITRWMAPMPFEEAMDPALVGPMVADAIRDERYLILTDPEPIRERIARHGADPDAFVASQIESLPHPPNLYR